MSDKGPQKSWAIAKAIKGKQTHLYRAGLRMEIGSNGRQGRQIHVDREGANCGQKTENNRIAHKTRSHGRRAFINVS
jgi:hypothetical protein